jgi:ArsR family transcriptional regulator, cadmium/lead-responsive transcriptional repressor
MVMFSESCIIQPMLTVPDRTEAMNRLGRALADPTRSRLLLALLDGPAYPGQLATRLGLTRSNVSNHLSCLRGCGLVVATPEGRAMRYEIAGRRLSHALGDLLDVVLAVNPGVACVDEPAMAPAGTARILVKPAEVSG